MKREELKVDKAIDWTLTHDKYIYFYHKSEADKVMDAMEQRIKELEAEVIGYKASLERANFRMCEKDARIHELKVENEKLRDENAKLKTFNRGDFEEFADILDKHYFYCQRAGYESWFEKPKAVQDKDIENRKLDYERMKFFFCIVFMKNS